MAKNETFAQPTLNLTLARAYLSTHDPNMNPRTWADVMREMATHGIASTRQRCGRAFASKAFDSIRNKPSLHSYRHSWAQRAKACGYPQRFAQSL